MTRPSSETSSSIDNAVGDEKLPFLDESSRSERGDSSRSLHHHRSHQCHRCLFIYWPLIILFQFVFTATIVTVIVHRFSNPQSSSTENGRNLDLTYPELLRPAVKYTVYTPPEDWWEQPLYTDLSSESGMAWYDLLSKQPFRISQSEIDQFNIPVSLWDGKGLDSGGFPAVLTVFHNLHCLRHIKQELFKEHYFPGRTPEQAEARIEHTKHCMENLRQSVMCNADLTPLPLRWSVEQNTSYVKPETLRRCMDWDSLLENTKGRKYAYEEIIPKDL